MCAELMLDVRPVAPQFRGAQPLRSLSRRSAKPRSARDATPTRPTLFLPPSHLPSPHLRRVAATADRPTSPTDTPPRSGSDADRPCGRGGRCTSDRSPGDADQPRYDAAPPASPPAAEGRLTASDRHRRLGYPQGADLRHPRRRSGTAMPHRLAARPLGFDRYCVAASPSRRPDYRPRPLDRVRSSRHRRRSRRCPGCRLMAPPPQHAPSPRTLARPGPRPAATASVHSSDHGRKSG